jgi:hypothetical protein
MSGDAGNVTNRFVAGIKRGCQAGTCVQNMLPQFDPIEPKTIRITDEDFTNSEDYAYLSPKAFDKEKNQILMEVEGLD